MAEGRLQIHFLLLSLFYFFFHHEGCSNYLLIKINNGQGIWTNYICLNYMNMYMSDDVN